jgi:hypothetical protein
MSGLDELPPDQSAALSLLLRQRKSYAEVAELLGIGERPVHDRAQAALVMLAPRRARELPPERRLEVGDYLLGQQPGVAERLRTRTYLGSAEPARAWANELTALLAPFAGASLPEVPASSGAATAATSAAPREPQRVADLAAASSPSATASSASGVSSSTPVGGASAPAPDSARGSRTAGAALLAVIAVAVIVAVVLITSGGGSHAKKTTTEASTTTTTGKGKGPKVEDQITLKAVHPGDKIIAVVYVLSEGSKRAFFIAAQNLPPTRGFYYAIWLYDSPTHYLALSRSPTVGSKHSIEGGSALPPQASEFHEILLTEETKSKPTHPGLVIMRAPFKA